MPLHTTGLDMRSILRLVLTAVPLALALTACGDDYGEPCDMPNTPEFNALCESNPDRGTDATCVFSNSAQCTSRVCARFQGSTDFCSDFCTADEDCPGTSVCYAPPGNAAFCIPESIFGQSGAPQ